MEKFLVKTIKEKIQNLERTQLNRIEDMLKNYLIHQMSNWNKKFMYIIKKMKHGTLKKIQCLNLIQIIFHI